MTKIIEPNSNKETILDYFLNYGNDEVNFLLV